MNTIGLMTTGYTNLGAIQRTAPDGTTSVGGTRSPETARRSDATDRVELSDHARFMERLRSMPGVRVDKVASIKAQIDAGTYDTDDKLSLALERMLEDVTEGGPEGPEVGTEESEPLNESQIG
jgi:flagellar biosynthesis anti-sigma factor FlgM